MNGISRLVAVIETQITARPADTSPPPSGRCRHIHSIQTRNSAQILSNVLYFNVDDKT
jgi:hypothetical protein